MSRTYWNPDIETLDADGVRALEEPFIAPQIRYVYEHSPYYRNKWNEAGIDVAQINCHETLATLPFTEKSDVVAAQQRGSLLGDHQCAPFDDVVRLVCTGGSSGEPTRLGWTRDDVAVYNEMGARALWGMGCRPGDLVINCFNYSLYAGGIMDHGAFEYLGAGILPYGVGKSERLLDLLTALPVREGGYTLYSTPSYAIRLHELAQQRGIDLRSLQINKGIFSGEPGLQVDGYRRKIEQAWGMRATDLYGAAELGVQSGECEHRNGLHYSGAGLVIAELIDSDSGDVKPMRDGDTGELVFTTIKRQACPLIRLRTHDTVQVYTEPCKCGRKSFRFHVLGRNDDMFIVKGVNVFPLGIQEALLSHRPAITGEFIVTLPKAPPIDYSPILYIEVSDNTASENYPALRADIRATVQSHVNFTPTINFVPQGSIASEHKTKRLYREYNGVQAPSMPVLYSENS